MKNGITQWVLLAVLLVAIIGFQPVMEGKIRAQPAATGDATRVHYLEQLTQDEIDALDRERSIFFLTFGNLEAHGPAAPVGSDYFRAITIRDGLIDRLRNAHPDYDFIVFPVVPLGEGGANLRARQPDHIGTYSVRFETLRDVAIDLGVSVARKGFRNIFVIEAHGSPLHNVAFNQASDFVSERYGVRMVSVTPMSKDILGSGEILNAYLGKDWRQRSGFEGHAGASETSEVLATEGARFVHGDYKQLEPFYVDGPEGFYRTHEMEGWRGYWGDPGSASFEMGKALIEHRVDAAFRVAEIALAGEELGSMPRYPDNNPDMYSLSKDSRSRALEGYAALSEEIDQWLRENPWPPKGNR
jgi:creatinine amidohydrolase/Fe(II)-dependent formamide hydrolase-like protein